MIIDFNQLHPLRAVRAAACVKCLAQVHNSTLHMLIYTLFISVLLLVFTVGNYILTTVLFWSTAWHKKRNSNA